MKYYDTNTFSGIHKVKVTLQSEDYKGHIYYDMGGNCKGRSILDFDFECADEDSIVDNDCDLKYDEDCEMFTATLTNDNGDSLEIECFDTEMNDMIVAVEILSYEADEEDDDE